VSPRKTTALRPSRIQLGAMMRFAACLLVGGLVWAGSAARADSFYVVDVSKPNCSDTGPGTVAAPYCSITAAVNAHSGAGVTIFVKPGTYREQVTVPASGASGSPLIIQALGSPVVIDGADDFSTTGQWSAFAGSVWLASSVTWNPIQVFVDGARLSPSTLDPASLPPSSFRFVDGQGLFVNLNGDNPGTHDTQVSARSHAFRLPGRSWVKIDGFTVRHTQDHGIYLIGPGANLWVINNQISLSGSHGIGVVGCSDVMIGSNVVHHNQDHGISLISGVSASTVENNQSFANSRPTGIAASGIYLHGSPNNLVQGNRSFDNQDTGVEIDSLSNDVTCRQNMAWNNGDHGFIHLRSHSVSHFGDVAWGNAVNGFSIEGDSQGAVLYNCIAIDNGLATNSSDLFVDPLAVTGFTSDFNLFWNSSSQQPIRFNGVRYATIAGYSSASGQDVHTIQANPLFADAAAGDFDLLPGSPAIDSGYSWDVGWPALDASGQTRYDDPATPNTGVGPIAYADRGALEYQGSSQLAVGGDPSIEGLSFSSAYPNPSAGKVSFVLELPRAAHVEWSVMDVQGRVVWSQSMDSDAGRRTLAWNGRGRDGSPAQPGAYLAVARVGGAALARRFTLLR
jgi:parallel beta-helix repeat protein